MPPPAYQNKREPEGEPTGDVVRWSETDGGAGNTYTELTSTNLLQWTPLSSVQTDVGGQGLFIDFQRRLPVLPRRTHRPGLKCKGGQRGLGRLTPFDVVL